MDDKISHVTCGLQKHYYSGIFFAVVAALAFGTNPLFARMLYAHGFSVDCVLLFRFLPATIGMGMILLGRGHSLRITSKEALFCLGVGLMFCMTSWTLFQSYQMIDVGVAATLLFSYPVLVTIISALCFREKIGGTTLSALALAIVGVALISASPTQMTAKLPGVALALLSAFFYAGYLVMIGHNTKSQIDSAKLTFYVLVTCVCFYTLKSIFGSFQMGTINMLSLLNIVGLSVISAGIALGCASMALKRCSPAIVSVLGALDPLSATFWGVTVFHEKMNFQIALGMALILLSVVVIVCPQKRKNTFSPK